MQVGIIGSGNIGAGLARGLVALGHDVAVANSRDAGALADSWRQQPGTPVYGPRLDAGGVREALTAARRPG